MCLTVIYPLDIDSSNTNNSQNLCCILLNAADIDTSNLHILCSILLSGAQIDCDSDNTVLIDTQLEYPSSC